MLTLHVISRPITYSGSFTVNSGLGSLGVYGWTTNPLVEYYVMETNHGISTGGTNMGTFTSDGATYTIWKHQQVNQPSIQGTSTFWQYISIRNSPRTSGTVTLQNHFSAWAGKGMNLGTQNMQVIAVESWSGSGSASQTISH
jgi:endo-1,4-beta-xylanase